jgi:hypothetical protein
LTFRSSQVALATAFLVLSPVFAHAQSLGSVTCSTQTQTPNTIRNEGKTEQIADYSFQCTNTGTGPGAISVQTTLSPSLPITSKSLNSGGNEVAIVVQDSTGRQTTRSYLGSISGSTVNFSGVTIPVSTDTSNYQPFIVTITNVRVDATSLTAGAAVSESGFVSGAATLTLPSTQMATVQPGLGPQSVTGVINRPVCTSTFSATESSFKVLFGENTLTPAAFKIQGTSLNNNTVGSWLSNNTESGYYVTASGSNNLATSGTRVRVIFANIPANVAVYVPQSLSSDQAVSGSPVGTMTLTSNESGAYSIVPPSSNPAGYTGTAPLVQLTINNGLAEAVYEVTGDSASVVETYGAPVYLVATGTVTAQTAAITAVVSFAPVGASANLPNFSQLSSTTPVSGSTFPTCLNLSTSAIPTGVYGIAYSYTVAASGGTPPYTWSLNGTSLPAGLTLNTSTGAISGTPTTTSAGYPFTIKLTDSGGQSSTANYSIQINSVVIINLTSPPVGAVSENYSSFNFTATGGLGVYTFSVVSGSLPPGLSLNTSTGAVTGTPTTAGTYSPVVKALDSSGSNNQVAFSFRINPALAITTSTLPVGVVGTAYPNTGLAANFGGTGAYTWTVSSGALPAGLNLDTFGNLTGTPTAAGSANVTIKVTDGYGAIATQAYTITINPVLAIPAQTITQTTGNYFTQQLTSTGGSGSNQWLLSAGSLPPGVGLGANGVLFGITSTVGSYNVTVRVSDSLGDVASRSLTLQINAALTFSTSSQLPNAVANYPYTGQIAATGGFPPYTYRVSAGTPSPFTLVTQDSTTAAVTGTDGGSGSISFTVNATDSAGFTASQAFNITVNPSLSFDFVSMVRGLSPLAYFRLQGPSGTSEVNSYTYNYSSTGAAYVAANGQFPNLPVNEGSARLDGATGNVTTSLSGGINISGSMMAWVKLSALPSTKGTFSYVAGESTSGNDFDLQFSTTNTLNFYTTNGGQYLGYTPDPTTLVNTWHMIVVTFDNSAAKRVIYWDGQPVASDTTLSITNKTGAFEIGDSSVFTGRNFPGAIDEVAVWNFALTPAFVAQLYNTPLSALPTGILNQSYGRLILSGEGGSGSYLWSATGLPAGITLAQNGFMSGTPTVAGTFPVALTATDAVTSQTFTQTYSLVINPALAITSVSLPTGTVNSAYTQSIAGAAAGGTGSGYQWTVSSGNLPPGITLSALGVLSGTPTAFGSFTFYVQVTDNGGNTATQTQTLVVNAAAAPLRLTTTSIPGADQGSSYFQTLAATGGTGAYTWSLASGTLPTGLTLTASTGVLSGTPTVSGSFSFSVQVTDAANNTAAQTLPVVVNAPLVFTTATLPATAVNASYNQRISASGGLQPYTFTAGTLPPGITLSSGGAIGGTPTTAGTYPFQVRLTDTLGYSISTNLQIVVTPALTITTTSLPAGQQNVAYAASLSATGGSGSGYTFSLLSSVAPLGMSLTTAGAFFGTPTTAGTFSLQFQVTDSNNTTATATLPLVVSTAGTVITTNLPANTAIVNISATTYGAGNSSGANQIYWSSPITYPSGPLLEYTVQPGAYTFRVINPADALSLYPSLTTSQQNSIFTGWTYNSPWIESYLVFDSSAAQNSGQTQLFSGAELNVAYGNATDAYNAAVAGGYYNQLHVGARNAAVTYTYTFANTTTLIFAVPDSGLYDNQGGVSVLISPAFSQISILTASPLPAATANASYSQTFTASGGSGSYSWSATGLPQGLTLSRAGVLSGTPGITTTGPNSFMVTLTDLVSGATTTQTFALTVVASGTPLTITTTSLTQADSGSSYSQSLAASGGTAPYTWSLASGTLPNNLAINATSGVISGVPQSTGTYNITVKVTDSLNATATQALSLVVNPALGFTTATLPDGFVGVFYSQSLAGSGGKPPYTYNWQNVSVPGLTFNSSTGMVSGTPTTAGNYYIVLNLVDSLGNTLTDSFHLNFTQPLTITTSSLPPALQNAFYSASLGATGGAGSGYRFGATGLPPGLTLSTAGVISGTPTGAGLFSVQFVVVDANNNTNGMATLPLNVSPASSTITQNLPANTAILNVDATQYGAFPADGAGQWLAPFTQTGGAAFLEYTIQPGTYTFRVINLTDAQAIYPALTNSQLSNIFTAWSPGAGSFQTSYLVFDSSAAQNNVATQLFSGAQLPSSTLYTSPANTALAVRPGARAVRPHDFYDTAAQAYAAAVAGGYENQIYVGSQNAPATNTYTFANAQTLLFVVPQSSLASDTGGVSILISPTFPAISISTAAPLPSATAGTPYSQTFAATGGSGSYSWSSTYLPGFATLSTSGILTGTPQSGDVGSNLVAVTVTDLVSGLTASQNYTLTVNAPSGPALTITTSSLPTAVVGTAYTQTLAATGGTGSDTWTLQSGSLPAGITLATNGTLSGTPTVNGPFTFTVRATDQASASATRQLTLQVNAPLTITTLTLPAATQGSAYSQTLAASGGVSPYTWSVIQGTFTNAGFALNASTGAITGVPVTANTLTFTVQATDANNNTAIQTLAVTINLQTTSAYDFAVATSVGIRRVSADGTRSTSICAGAPCHSIDLTTDSAGNIYTHDAAGIAKISPTGGVTQLITLTGNSLFPGGTGTGGLALDGLGNIVFVDNNQDAIYRMAVNGTGLVKVAAFPILSPTESQYTYVTLDHFGNYVVVSDDNQTARVYIVTPGGSVNTRGTFATRGTGGVQVDSNGNVIFADYRNHALVSVDSEGTPTVIAQGQALCCNLVGLTTDPALGSYISGLTTGNLLVRVTAAGAATTLAGGLVNTPTSVAPIPALSGPTITQTSLPGGTAGQSYSPVTLTATGGSGTYTWSATGLPQGLGISAGGVISGVPLSAGTFSASITVTDSVSTLTGRATLPVTIAPGANTAPPVFISQSASFLGVALGGSVSATFSAQGGTPPFTFTASGLPSGVSLSSGGSLSGTPAQAGTFTASVQVADSRGMTAVASLTIGVLGLTTTSLPAGTAGQPYSAGLTATGGTPGYSFSATGIPAGLSIGQSGSVTGTVRTPGTYSMSVRVADSGGLSVSGSVSVTFARPQALTVSGSSLPAGTVGTPYSQPLAATGGLSPYTWALSSGSAPPGLSMNSSGIVSGIPLTPGTFSFGVMATDGSGAIATALASLTVQPLALTINTQSLPAGVNGLGYPQQVMSASGGVAPYTWSLSAGNLPAGLTLTPDGSLSGLSTVSGNFPITVKATDSAGTAATTGLSILVRPSSVDLILTGSSLSYSLLTPAGLVPASAQQVGVQSTQASQQISYSVAVSPAASWLSVSNGSTTPDNIATSLTAAALSLSPGAYSTTITVTCTSNVCSGHTLTVSVSLNVKSSPPQLGVTTDLLAFGASSSAPVTQSIGIQNAGGGTLGIGSVSCEAAWCTAGSIPGALSGGASASIPVTVNPGLLTPGFFRTQVDIVSSAGRGSVPVTVLISSASQLTLAPAGVQFGMQAGGVPGNSNGSFLVTVVSGAPVNWTAAVLPGAPWLTLATPSGTSSATAPGPVSFSIDPKAAGALSPGAYYGRIEITSPGILNSPQDFEVVLSVSPATTAVIPDPEPQGLLFITSQTATPPPQTISVYSGSTAPAGFQASATTANGGSWLAVSPGIGSASVGSPGVTTVTVNPSSLTPGVYRGGVSYSLSATAVRVVSVTLIVTPPGVGPQFTSNAVSQGANPKAGSCAASTLVPAQVGLVNSFSQPVAWPVPLTVALADNCGSVIKSAQLVATFSNGDPPLPLTLADPGKGLYSGTWTPRSASPQMTVIAHASAAGYPEAVAQVAGSTVPNVAPVLTPHGTLHSFDPLIGAALAPGTIIQIYGQHLASQTAQPTSIPLPTSMNGTSVLVGGIPAPLYYVSPGQINAQLPFELNPSNQYQLLVSFAGSLSSPDTVQLSAATPGLAAFGDGTLIAQHGDGSLVSATAPAKPGEYLVAYLAGMGGTNATPDSGAASPASPLALPTLAPTLTMNGAAYPIAFAGLTPGLVGLYQMNFQVPAGLPAGNLALVVTQSGQVSNQTVLPYQP